MAHARSVMGKEREDRMVVRAADRYDPADDLWLITAYFNPIGYHSKRRNYEHFRQHVCASGLRLLTVECAFGDAPFSFPASADLLHVRAKHVMWQKERLLNVAVAHLPAQCTKIAWLDCDIVFENPAWALETSRRLEHSPVVQPFEQVIRLTREGVGERDWRAIDSFGRRSRMPARVFSALDSHAGEPNAMVRHGHTGYVWAARREVIARSGLYDACIIGGGDHLIAHAMRGESASPCVARVFAGNEAHGAHFARWSETLYPAVGGKIDHVPGTILHLWHGDNARRRYVARHGQLAQFGFDPRRDIRLGIDGCWEWASDKPALHNWAAAYFAQRYEDGEPASDPPDPPHAVAS